MKTTLVLLTTLIFTAGCQDPTPIEGKITESEILPAPIPPIINFKSETTFNCSEGEACVLPVAAIVPEPGTPLIRFDRLPAGAVYDSVNSQVLWNPSFDMVNVDGINSKTTVTYEVDGFVTSSDNEKLTTHQTFQFVLNNTPRSVELIPVTANAKGIEGISSEYGIRVSAPDFPSGRVLVYLDGAPEGMTISQNPVDSNLYTVYYKAPYGFASNGSKEKELSFWVKWITPHGKTGRKLITWNIQDKRIAPFVSAPDFINLGQAMNFVILVEDINGEEVPTLYPGILEDPNMKITAELLPGKTRPSVYYYNIQISGVGPDAMGKTFQIPFMACVSSGNNTMSLCTPKVTSVQLGPTRSSQ